MADQESRPGGAAHFDVELGNADFEFETFRFDDQIIVGTQIAAAAGAHPIEAFAILQHLASGELESLRPNESVDLAKTGIERFFVVEGASNHRFTVEGLPMEWPQDQIAAKHIKFLAKAATDMVLIIDLDDGDKRLKDDDVVDLSEPGVERFKLRKKGPEKATIWVNQEEHAFAKDKISYDEVIALYLNDGGSQSTQYLVKYSRGHSSDASGTLAPGSKVKVKDGMRFRVSGTGES